MPGRILRMTVASAAIGVVSSLAAAILSVVLAVQGAPNHLSGDQLLLVFAVGSLVGIPIAWFWLIPFRGERK
jgi:hypothetical protein